MLEENNTIKRSPCVENIILKYKDHASMKLIKNLHSDKIFTMPLAKEGNVKRILLNLNPKKVLGSDKIPPKVISRSAECLCKALTNIINATIIQQKFPENTKLSKVTPIYKNQTTNKLQTHKCLECLFKSDRRTL